MKESRKESVKMQQIDVKEDSDKIDSISSGSFNSDFSLDLEKRDE